MVSSFGLISGFLNSFNNFPDHPALFVENRTYSYRMLYRMSTMIASTIKNIEENSKDIAAFLGYRSIGAFSSMLGILMAGKGYVPLNPNFPNERLAHIIDKTDVNVLVVSNECIDLLDELLSKTTRNLKIIILDTSNKKLSDSFCSVNINISDPADISFNFIPVDYEKIAYLLFTSGSTGEPKGVPITHANAKAYIDYTCDRYKFNETDRFSQTADMSFDLSILEIYPCFESASCLYCLPKSTVMLPAKFIRENQLTVWISVPSVGTFMDRMRLFKPGAFPSLRYCLFDGEPLLGSIAEKWRIAAVNAIVENLYGPTEATVAITDYRWEGEASLAQCKNGIVPIGRIFPEQLGIVIDENSKPVKAGTKGELCLSGSQLTKGYYNDPEKTAKSFIIIKETGDRLWYKTGDVVTQDENGCLYHLGRTDHQIKILGYRVELQEIDFILRKCSNEELATTIAWPVTGTNAEGVIAFIPSTCKLTESDLIEKCKVFLPAYMVPSQIIFIDNMPMSNNGKIDRIKLKNYIERQQNGFAKNC